MKKIIICLLLSLFTVAGCITSVSAVAKGTAPEIPSASLKSGTYQLYEITKVYLSCKTDGADIYYSLNDSKYKLYSDRTPVALTANADLKIYAVKDGVKSKARLYKYRFKPKFKISHKSGKYDGEQIVKLQAVTSKLEYYYTLDGSKPTVYSSKYTDKGIFIDDSCKLRILITRKNWSNVYISLDLDITPSPDTIDEMSNTLYDYQNKYCYNSLTDTQKNVYAAFYDMAVNHEQKKAIFDLKASEADVSAAYWAFDYDNPQFFWLGHGYGAQRNGSIIENLHLSFSRTVNQADSLSEKFNEKAEELVAKALNYTNTVERIKFIHDMLIVNTDYVINREKYIYEADGPIVYGEALCDGYAKAFMYICQATGIECICVSNDEHTWNMVKIKNRWYHVDVTYDDINSPNELYSYRYFLVSTPTMLQDRDIQCFFPIPESIVDYNHDFS